MSDSSSESSSQRIPQPPRNPKLPPIIHPVDGMDRESLQQRKRTRLAWSWVLLSCITGVLVIGMVLGILAVVLSPGNQSTVYVAQLDHRDADSSSFLRDTERREVHLPTYVRLGVQGYCVSEDKKFRSRTCEKYGKSVHWDNATEIYSDLLKVDIMDLVMPPKMQNTTGVKSGRGAGSSGFPFNGQGISLPIIHGIALLLIGLALGALGYRSSATVHIWLTFIALGLLVIGFIISGLATLGDTWGFYTRASKGLNSYGVEVTPGWGFRSLFYLMNVFDFITVLLMGLAITIFLD